MKARIGVMSVSLHCDAEALKNFSQVFYALTFNEREELMKLLIKDIADKIGLSVITVRQLLQLGKLSPEIQTYILNLKPKDAIKRFSQKKLRKLPPLSHEEQHKEFKKEWELEL